MKFKKFIVLAVSAVVLAAVFDDEKGSYTSAKPSPTLHPPEPFSSPSFVNPSSLSPSKSIRPQLPKSSLKLEVKKPTQRALYVTGSVVNVRTGPSTSYERLFQMKKGQAVQELDASNGWTKLTSDGRVGWMHSDFLSANRPVNRPVKSIKPETPVKQKLVQSQKKARCHPSYTGACVPFASDVDCASGSGNGPAYVRGPVRVVGPDVYRLDRDKDGIGCERG